MNISVSPRLLIILDQNEILKFILKGNRFGKKIITLLSIQRTTLITTILNLTAFQIVNKNIKLHYCKRNRYMSVSYYGQRLIHYSE